MEKNFWMGLQGLFTSRFCAIKHLKQQDRVRDHLPAFIGSLDHPLTSVSWENGKEASDI
jgi:hypothetical protein